jgi:type II secretory pathway component PulC
MRPGDKIVGINGFDLDTGKARAHRSVLEAIHADGFIQLTVRQGDRTQTHEMKIRKR